ncbi:hypothetical protein Enr10x_37310 [Gimesia panareensis]|uniref:Lipoprotein n=1 Tax=Gimesia panareensis TaxID=2527978 RepID=A0A517Q9T7_9PLAN|nr:hypothetical protein [Gimesia panareensis]QDT28389.1 hypothetical protein Enr10x_37310 [Gimesia panareensis]
MKWITAIAGFLLLAGCQSDELTAHTAPEKQASTGVQKYIVLTVPPEPLLDKMALLYSPEDAAWPQLVDEFVENGHPILPYAIRQLQEDEKISPDVANQILDRVNQSPTVPVDAQRIITLLEVACYADVMCHRVEYPLRVATLDYVKSNLDAPGTPNALAWIRESYQSGLPLDVPDDETGELRGLLVKSMRGRLNAYANQVTDATNAEPGSK